jgi:hypothetical protein
MKTIEDVKIGSIEVVIEGERNWDDEYDFGALTLKCEDREFILDVCQSYTDGPEATGENFTRITLDVEVDEDIFDECPYNITKQDLLDCEHNDLTRELYIGGNFENKILSIDFFFEIDGQDYQMKLEQE